MSGRKRGSFEPRRFPSAYLDDACVTIPVDPAPATRTTTQGTSKRHWVRGVQTELTRANLIDLANARIPAIYVRSFLDGSTAEAIGQRYSALARGYYKNVVPRISKCGPTVFEHQFEDRRYYFQEAREAEKLFSSLMDGVVSPLARFRQIVSEQTGLVSRMASDRALGDYFAGTLRSIEEGTPVHIDFAPHESPEWETIGFVEAQLSAYVYLDGLAGPGDLVIHEKLWTLGDEQYRFGDRFGYDEEAIRAASFEAITPATGAIILFNSRFFHHVEASWQRRLTYSFFFAFQDDHLALWS